MASKFEKVRGLTRTLERALGHLKERQRRVGSICPIPEDFDRPTAELVKHCKKRIEKAENFRRSYEKKASVRFIVQIALICQYDQIDKHKTQLKDCKYAVKLATETIEVMSRAHEQNDLLDQDGLLKALRLTGGRDYLRRMKKAGCNLNSLRIFSESQLHQSPRRVAPRGMRSTSSHRSSDHSTVPAHIMHRDRYQSHPSQQAGHDPRSTFTEVRHPGQIGVRGGQHSFHQSSDDNHMNHPSEARDRLSTRRRNSAHHNSTTSVDEPTTYRRSEVNNDIQPEFSSSNHTGRNRMPRTMRSRSVSPEDGYHARREGLRAMPLSHCHEDYQQAVRSRESSRRRRSSSINEDNERQSGRSSSVSTLTSRSLSMSQNHQTQSRRSRTSSYGSAVDVAPNPRRRTRVNRSLSRVSDVEMVPLSPTSSSRMTSRRTSSASSYDSAIFMPSTRHHIPDRRDTNGTSSTAPRRPHVLQSRPPLAFHFDENRPNANRKSLKKQRTRSSRSR